MGSAVHRWLTEVDLGVVSALALFIAHLWLIAPVLQNGDGAVYNEQIEQHALGIRTPHVGYMVLGIVFNAVLPFGTERNLNLMCLAFASAGAAAAIVLARKCGASWTAALFAGLLIFGIRPYLRGAVLAEVDGVACSLILLSLACWVHERRVAGGVLFGAAMLVTPLSSLSLPALLFTRIGGKSANQSVARRLLDVAVLGAAALVTYAPFVWYFWDDYWHGGRGLLRAPRETWDVHAQIMRSVHFLSESAMPWLGLGLTGILVGVTARRSIAFGTGVALIGAALVGERFLDVPVQLPQLCMMAVLAVLVVDRIANKLVVACSLASVLLITAVPNYLDERDEIQNKLELAATYREMAKETPKLMVVGVGDSWIDGLQFERVVYHRTKLGLGLDYKQFRGSSRSIARTHRDYAIWLATPAPPGTMTPFAQGWRRENRNVLGRAFEVWLPSES